MDRLAHFDITIQHIAGSNLKFTDFLSRNLVEEAATEDAYDEQYVINVLSEQAELNIEYSTLFANQSQNTIGTRETTETKSNDQSNNNRTFEKNRDVNKTQIPAKFASNNCREKFQVNTSTDKTLNSTAFLFKKDMDRD